MTKKGVLMVDSWTDNANDLRQERARQEHDDLNNEMAGRETGRIKRFTTPETINGSSSKKDDNFIEIASQILSMEQHRQIAQLNQQFELNRQAIKLALDEVNHEIILAEQEYKRIQNNATVLTDGRRVYRDEENGQFFDEDDNSLSAADEVEALDNYKDDNSSRQQNRKAFETIDKLNEEKAEIKKYQAKQDELQDRLKENPQDADEIEAELDNMPMPDRVKAHHQTLSSEQNHEVRNESTISAARDVNGDGIKSDISLTPAFKQASDFKQMSNEPAQRSEPAPRPDQGLTV